MTNKEKIVEALVYIEWHLKEGIDISRVANEVGYSTRYLKKLFRETTGYNIEAYLLKRRLTEALKEIVAEPENIFRIAYEYGFTCFSKFTNLFFRQFKILPNDIRRDYSYKACVLQEPIVYDVIRKIKETR